MKIVGIIQARMESTRLPGKVLMPMAGDSMLGQLVERTRKAARLDDLIVATSAEKTDDAVAGFCQLRNVPCVRGSLSDVLGRFLGVAQSYSADVIVRLTGDNPLVDGSLIDWVLERYLSCSPRPDYAANFSLDPTESGFPYGLYVEVVTRCALEFAGESNEPMDREHVTWFVRNRPDRFRQLILKSPGRFPYERVTVDTPEDYLAVRKIFESHFAANSRFGFADLMFGSK